MLSKLLTMCAIHLLDSLKIGVPSRLSERLGLSCFHLVFHV